MRNKKKVKGSLKETREGKKIESKKRQKIKETEENRERNKKGMRNMRKTDNRLGQDRTKK